MKQANRDNVKVFLAMRMTLKKMRIDHTTTSAHTHESSEEADRMNRTLLEKVRAMMRYTGMSYQYKSEAVSHPAYLYSRIESHVSGMKTSFKLCFEKAPITKMIKVLRSEAYTYIHKASRKTKLLDHVKSSIYLGTEGGLYRVRLLRSSQVITTKHVTFDESFFLCSGTDDKNNVGKS